MRYIKKDGLGSRDEVLKLTGFTIDGWRSPGADLFSASPYLLEDDAGVFSKEKTIPLTDIKMITLKKPRGSHLGQYKVLLKDGTEKSFSHGDRYPLRVRLNEGESKRWRAVAGLVGLEPLRFNQFTGAAEDAGRQVNVDAGGQSDSMDWSVEFLSAEDIASRKAYLDRVKVAEEKRQAEEVEKANRRLEAQVQRDQLNREAQENARVTLVSQKIGAEDSCKRILSERRVDLAETASDPADAKVSCQFAGQTSLAALQGTGWLIVSKERATFHVGTDLLTLKPAYNTVVINYMVRKAR